MREIGFAVLFGIGGIVAAVFYTFVIGFAGVPGALLSSNAAKRSSDGVTPLWGILVTVAGQLYASLVFVALVIQFIESRIAETTGFGKWAVWGVSFFVAVAPPVIAVKDATRPERRNVQHTAATLTAPLTIIRILPLHIVPGNYESWVGLGAEALIGSMVEHA